MSPVAIAETEGGSCNTHLTATTGRPPTPKETGIDTWRLVRYLDSDNELDHACSRTDDRGLLPDLIAGHRVGVLPAYRMLWIEGHPVDEGLAAPATLKDAERRVLDALDNAYMPTGKNGGIGRLDQTVTLRFDTPDQGIAFLYGVASADLPRSKPAVYGNPPETVYVLAEQSGRKLARVYDKGLESGTAERGQLIRLENQTRFGKEARMSADTLSDYPEFTSGKFRQRFAPLAESLDGVHAASLPVLAEHLAEKVHTGELTPRQAERFGGYLLLSGTRFGMPSRTRRRRRRELRDHGLVLANPLTDPVDVDLGEALDVALNAWGNDAAA